MKKISIAAFAAAAVLALSACGASSTPSESPAQTETSAAETSASAEAAESSEEAEAESSPVDIRIGSLKGPTSMGLVYLMDETEKNPDSYPYEFSMSTAADELVGKMVKGDLDIALLPANVSSVIYNKTKNVSVIDINTLGVLYMVSSDDSIQSVADLKGKTVYLTGMGTSPDYVLRYLLKANAMTDSDVTLEYKSEPTEVAAILKEDPSSIGLLPQPFVTAACAQNEALKIVLDLTAEWDKVQEGENGSALVTGVTIVNNDFLKENPEAVARFIEEHTESALYTSEHPDEASELIAKAGIIEKAPVAKKALPYCNITCITGEKMQAALSGYLEALFEEDPSSVGGALPDDSFYYLP